MIDQSGIDLLQLVGGDLRRVARTQGGEWAGACPFCGGRDRFRVWPQAEPARWWCRQCERHGDAISFVQQREQVPFGEALQRLGLDGVSRPVRPDPPPARPPEPTEPPVAAWQQAARALVADSIAALHGDYTKPLTYLRRRGFTPDTIATAQLGYHSRDRWVPRSVWGPAPDGARPRLWLPRGIVIPWFSDGQLWRVVIRRPAGDPKYYCIPGSANAVYNADTIRPDRPLVLVEAAFDALAIQQTAGDLCAAVATGTTGGRTLRWISRIARAPVVLPAYDNDAGGETPIAYWRDVLRERARIWRPYTDDPAGMLERGLDVRGWIAAGVLAAAPPDPATLEVRLFAAADAGDWALAYALAAHHPDPAGARVFLAQLQQMPAEEAEEAEELCAAAWSLLSSVSGPPPSFGT
jgi:DNA primase